jgi:hypothetical protein
MITDSKKRHRDDDDEEEKEESNVHLKVDKSTQTESSPTVKHMETQTDDVTPEDQAQLQKEQTLFKFLVKIKESIVDVIKPSSQKGQDIFISYTWKPDTDLLAKEKHNERVTLLAKILETVGFNVIYDRNDLKCRIEDWMRMAVKGADKVILIGTPELCQKVTEGQKGNGTKPNILVEYEEILNRKEDTVFPVLFEGNWKSFPSEMHTHLIMDCSSDDLFIPGLLSPENPLGLVPALFNLRPSEESKTESAHIRDLRLLYAREWDDFYAKYLLLQKPPPPTTLVKWRSSSHSLLPIGISSPFTSPSVAASAAITAVASSSSSIANASGPSSLGFS